MRAPIFNEPGSTTVGERPDAAIAAPTDAVVRVVRACVCGSDRAIKSLLRVGTI
jgi:threonine dehydrogenase-like Zn-dependent dehydrogenase